MAKAKKAGLQPFAFGDLRKKAATDMKNQAGLQLAANLLGTFFGSCNEGALHHRRRDHQDEAAQVKGLERQSIAISRLLAQLSVSRIQKSERSNKRCRAVVHYVRVVPICSCGDSQILG